MKQGLRRLGATILTLIVLALVAAAFIAVAQPRIVVGDPLPQVASADFIEKPDPPKVSRVPPVVKAGAIDLVEVPASLTAAPPGDPLASRLAVVLGEAISRAGDAGSTGIHVLDPDGRVVFDSGGTQALIPASTAKLVTAAAAMTAFGPQHTFTTSVTASVRPVDTVIAGDVHLVGGGDPTLVSQAYIDAQTNPERPSTPISQLADQMVAGGLTRVDGAVIGVDAYLTGPLLADGWPPRYLEDLDATRIAGLTVDQGLELFTNDAGNIRARASEDPRLDAARALTIALQERGVTVAGAPQSADTSPQPTDGVVLAELRSPPLATLLARMIQNSDNHIADTLFRAVGRRIEGTGMFSDGLPQGINVLQELQLDWSTTSMADGSGLSRANQIPAALLTALNYRMTNSSVGLEWQDLMAVSGVSGTLRRRLPDTIAELRLRGKTGSLGDVRALSGAVVGPDGRPMYFTIISNGLEGPQLTAARRLQDLVVLGLAASLYNCAEVPPEVLAAQADAAGEPQAAPPDGLPPLPTYTCTG